MNRKIISRFESDKEKIEIISSFESDEEKNGMGNSSAGKLAHKKMWASEESHTAIFKLGRLFNMLKRVLLSNINH